MPGSALPAGAFVPSLAANPILQPQRLGIAETTLRAETSRRKVLEQRARRLRRVARQLRQSEAHLSLATDAAQIGTWDADVGSGKVTWSRAKERLFGLAPGTFPGTIDAVVGAIHPDDRARVVENWTRSADTCVEFEDEFRIIRADGAVRWMHAKGAVLPRTDGKACHIVGVTQDITVRKDAEQALRESEARFRIMADSAPVLIWVAGRDGGCTWFNQPWLDFTGCSAEESLGDRWVASVHPEDQQRCLDSYRQAFADRRPFTMEYRLRRRDGQYRWMLDHGTPRQEPGRGFAGYIGSCIDITDRRDAESSLREAMEELRVLQDRLKEENTYLHRELCAATGDRQIVCNSDAMMQVLQLVQRVAAADTAVLLLGETGTGKELLARAVHAASRRKDRPMVRVNCAALPAHLIESELFGHERGAFTGAAARRAGRFEVADGGTLFLDEIGELPLELQPKLLRVLQDGEFERLGSSKTMKVDVRVVTATNRDLAERVRSGTFRADLYYRLNVFPISVPPLRQRPEDIAPLAAMFLSEVSRRLGRSFEPLCRTVTDALVRHDWPGNVRELQNVIERAALNSPGRCLTLPSGWEGTNHVDRESAATAGKTSDPSPQPPSQSPPRPMAMIEVEREHVRSVLNQTNWRVEGPRGAARILGMNPSTLRFRMKKLGLGRTSNTRPT